MNSQPFKRDDVIRKLIGGYGCEFVVVKTHQDGAMTLRHVGDVSPAGVTPVKSPTTLRVLNSLISPYDLREWVRVS